MDAQIGLHKKENGFATKATDFRPNLVFIDRDKFERYLNYFVAICRYLLIFLIDHNEKVDQNIYNKY